MSPIGLPLLSGQGAQPQVGFCGGPRPQLCNQGAEVIRAAKEEGGRCVPGVATPTEGFAALAAGGDALKLFPGEALPPAATCATKLTGPPITT